MWRKSVTQRCVILSMLVRNRDMYCLKDFSILYAPGSDHLRHVVSPLSICLSVHPWICPSHFNVLGCESWGHMCSLEYFCLYHIWQISSEALIFLWIVYRYTAKSWRVGTLRGFPAECKRLELLNQPWQHQQRTFGGAYTLMLLLFVHSFMYHLVYCLFSCP